MCNGLLVEEQKTNMLTWSANTLGGGWWADQAYLQSTAIQAPDGSATVAKLNEGTSSVGYRIMRHDGGAFAANTVYTASIFMKAAETTYAANVGLGWYDPSGSGQFAYANFNVNTGAVLQYGEGYANGAWANSLVNAAVVPYANGWYRCSLTFTTGANTGGSIRVGLNYFSSPGGNSNGVYVWGGQAEQGYTATSFIYTSGSTSTRVQDDAKIDGGNLQNIINYNEGTVVTEAETRSVMTAAQGVNIANRYPNLWVFANSSLSISSVLWYGSVAEVYVNSTYNNQGLVPTGPVKYAVAIANTGGQSVSCMNGGSVVNRSGTRLGNNITFLGIGSANGGAVQPFNGTIKSLVYYPKRLPDSVLINLTSS